MNMIGPDWLKGIMFTFGCILYIIQLYNIKPILKVGVNLPLAKIKIIKTKVRKKVKPWKLEKKIFTILLGDILNSGPAEILMSQKSKITGFTCIIAILGFMQFFTHEIWIDIIIGIIGGITWALLIFYVITSLRRLIQLADVAKDLEVDLETILSWVNKYKIA